MLNILCSFTSNFKVFGENKIKMETLSDGVEHWYILKAKSKASFFTHFEKLTKIAFSSDSDLPFGKSVAFLVGVSKYKYLSPQLESVENDITSVSSFLISNGGFDEIYILKNEAVDRDIIERYIKHELPNKMDKNDRLLFYYSGHGDDNAGQTGYMQFCKAKKGEFYGKNVLAINDIEDWSNEVDLKHMLFILDCCASGLSFVSKDGFQDSNKLLVNTLSGNGSRIVLTAGTADQETFAIQKRKNEGYGVFTRAFLNAFSENNTAFEDEGFLTIYQIFSNIEYQVGIFASFNKKSVSPKLWQLQENVYTGTFVFLNPNVQNITLSNEISEVLNLNYQVSKIGTNDSEVDSVDIYLLPLVGGELFVNGEFERVVEIAQKITLKNRPTGEYQMEIRNENELISGKFLVLADYDRSYTLPVNPEKTFQFEPENNENAKTNIRIKTIGIGGEIYIDNNRIGQINNNEDLLVENIILGFHFIILKNKNGIITQEVNINKQRDNVVLFEPGKSIVVDTTPPMAPVNVKIIPAEN